MKVRSKYFDCIEKIAEEKEQSKSQEDIYAESIYQKFTSNKDTSLFPSWHTTSGRIN